MNPVQSTDNQNIAASTSAAPQVNTSPTNDKSVAAILLNEKLITDQIFEQIKSDSIHKGESIDKLLLESKLVSDEAYYEARAKLIGTPYVSISTLPFSPEALNFIPKALAERFNIIPFGFDQDRKLLSIAMSDPLDLETISFVRQKTGLNVATFQAIPSEITSAIQNQYTFGLREEVKEALKETEEFGVKTFDKQSLSQVIKEAPIARIVSTILEYAIKSRASDVHLEPQDDRIRVRYRIDGILYERLSLPAAVKEAVISRIKILSDMKIDEHRIPQDGRFNFKFGDEEVDLRVSTIPIVYGEKIVMRLLKKSGGVPTLTELGLNGSSLKALEASILRPHGIIIVCGPTGSGKTTSLYAVLSKLNTTRVNIMTLEDPIEYQMAGTNQVQINPEIGLTFAEGLRSFLRQDPNIILVGEIRDKETTDLAIQAALTGHLIFSTLHTSSAAGALPRLIDMGAETFLLASTMNAIVGQRIARKICEHCKKEYKPPMALVEEIRKTLGPLMTVKDEDVLLYKGEGCEYCGDSGYSGRVGIFEVLQVNETIARLILEKKDANTIEKEARNQGMITMQQDGYLKVLSGVSTINEVMRVAQE